MAVQENAIERKTRRGPHHSDGSGRRLPRLGTMSQSIDETDEQVIVASNEGAVIAALAFSIQVNRREKGTGVAGEASGSRVV